MSAVGLGRLRKRRPDGAGCKMGREEGGGRGVGRDEWGENVCCRWRFYYLSGSTLVSMIAVCAFGIVFSAR